MMAIWDLFKLTRRSAPSDDAKLGGFTIAMDTEIDGAKSANPPISFGQHEFIKINLDPLGCKVIRVFGKLRIFKSEPIYYGCRKMKCGCKLFCP